MSDVIVIRGAVAYTITLDPSVWIFDERKIDLRSYDFTKESSQNEQERYASEAGAQWDKELQEGAPLPSHQQRSLAAERKVLEGDYGINLAPFLDHAEPLPGATTVVIHREGKQPVTLPLQEARRAILQFAKGGKPIRDNGPVLMYLPEQVKNGEEPLDAITSFEVRIDEA
ncbi:hypothetical protein LOK74_10945 [Brevibacillus humidisoli]|uniref:hypothetical protein n=1 Tax=Brevibacillus humidisoli TaxID=2895522 RepID=UPI001E5C3DD5|nr:hypothetical protein [Brevibacillus humidisoli]UFJ42970.1 hypothetical protein LOK74_10945 [Brevibacillus humidisoli]